MGLRPQLGALLRNEDELELRLVPTGVVDLEGRVLEAHDRVLGDRNVPRFPLLQGQPLPQLRVREVVGLREMSARDGGEDELPCDLARGLGKRNLLRRLGGDLRRRARETGLLLGRVGEVDAEHGPDPRQEDGGRDPRQQQLEPPGGDEPLEGIHRPYGAWTGTCPTGCQASTVQCLPYVLSPIRSQALRGRRVRSSSRPPSADETSAGPSGTAAAAPWRSSSAPPACSRALDPSGPCSRSRRRGRSRSPPGGQPPTARAAAAWSGVKLRSA